MESFMGSFSHRNNSFFDEPNDSLANISTAMNRSKSLLNEMVANPNTTSKTPSSLLKTSILQSKSILSQSIAQETFHEPSN